MAGLGAQRPARAAVERRAPRSPRRASSRYPRAGCCGPALPRHRRARGSTARAAARGPARDVDRQRRIGIGAGRIVDAQRRLLRGRRDVDLAHRHAQLGKASRPRHGPCARPAAGRSRPGTSGSSVPSGMTVSSRSNAPMRDPEPAGGGPGAFLSLRRYDPDQVQRVPASPRRSGVSAPYRGSPWKRGRVSGTAAAASSTHAGKAGAA